jgi:hypothetical protein
MDELEPPDLFYVSAACGWLELGNPSEAAIELEKVSPERQRHLRVLEVRWSIWAAGEDWVRALVVADDMVIHYPDEPAGWLHQAYATRRAPGGTIEAASKILQAVVEKFPDQALFPFNLACYCCQLARLDEARAWLSRAFQMGDRQDIRRMALHDEDLRPLWSEIPAM